MKRYNSPVPRLTINQIAAAALRTDRKAWASLAAGIFLSLFLISATVLSVQGVMLARREKAALKTGWEDCVLLDHPEITDQQLREKGQFDQIGCVYLTARIGDGDKYVGYYDETGAALMNRRALLGRLPEAAGEIALDQDMLEYLRIDAQPGDEITLELTPPDGFAETRRYTLVGVLSELALERRMWSSRDTGRVFAFPNALVSADEPAFTTGRVVVHRLMTFARGANKARIMRNSYEEYEDRLYLVRSDGYLQNWYDVGNELDSLMDVTTLLAILLGLSLVLCAGVGVAQAMEGQLARRVEEIGMLRAVGATRRQIRRIFGRQTWLMALILAPFSLAAGCGFAWGLSRLFPDTALFRPTIGLLAPMLILSIVCIWLSSSLPLRRASRIMPMSVIRDTQLLRKAKRVKSQPSFKPALLLAKRQIRLHPTRQLGAALMALLTLFCAALGVLVAAESLRDYNTYGEF
ncbi:MAG: ABC transporter permease, partial [Clostridia bacterium]|nr:ABC transporter permease [Clostridia bacterium]